MPEDHVIRVKDLGMNAVFFTDHGNTSSHAQAEKAGVKHGIQTGYGCELYTAPTDPDDPWRSLPGMKWHQTVLAMNDEGYKNLNRIVSASFRDNFNRFPTTSAAMLQEHNEGLIVLSGCADSHLSCTLLGGKQLGPRRDTYTEEQFQDAKKVALWYQSIFGDRYYIEVQRFPGLARARTLNPAFERISEETGIPLVATADVHYPFPDENEMQRILHAAHRGGTIATVDADWEYDILLTYPLSDQEIYDDLQDTGLSPEAAREAILNTERIAERCKIDLPKNEPIKWMYDTDEFDSIEDYMWEQLRKGWDFRIQGNDHMLEHQDEYVDRLKYEMSQIIPKGFCDYFSFLSYLVIWAKEHKIAVGPARGSAAASLACYLMRITEIDPMQFPHMLFARFIDPNRLDLPDVDLDFADDRRHEVVQEAQRIFGMDRVGNIGNFTRYRGKNSLDDVARVYRIPTWEVETVKKLIVERSGGDARQSDSLADTFAMFPKAQDVVDRYPALELATRLEGNYRGLGVHAAGIVISNTPISDTCATYTRTKDGKTVSVIAYDKKDSEYVGMLKADFLGLKTMGMIGLCLDIIQMDLEDLYRVPITEQVCLDAFHRNDLTGIFQFEGRATQIVNADVSPTNFGHLADINALSRPGPLFSGMTAEYVKVKHGRAQPERLHPVVDELTGWTYGQIVYQEQVLSIVKDLAGFPIERVGDIRKIISQKLGQMAMANAYEEFEAGCWDTHQVKPELARKIWNFIATSSTYSFNQSHSVSYAMLAFWCQWLKQYHPTAFYASQLTKVGDGKDQLYKRGKLMQDAIKHDVNISPPDLNLSGENWRADLSTRTVLAGFQQVHGIGPANSKKIIDYRDGPLTVGKGAGIDPETLPKLDWPDLINVHGIGPKKIEQIVEFVNKEDPFDIDLVAKVLGTARLQVRGWAGVPTPTHHSTEMPATGTHDVIWIGLARAKNFKNIVEATRTRTGRDEADILAELKDPHLQDSCVIQAYDEGDEDVYLRVGRYDYPKFEEAISGINLGSDIVIIKGQKKEGFGISIYVKGMWVLEGEDDADTTESEDIINFD